MLTTNIRGVATGGGACPLSSISKPIKVQQFQFQTLGVLLFMVVQKLSGPEISRFSPCMLQFLDHSRRLFIFSLDLLKIFHEVIAASKCGPLARIEKQAMS